MRRSSILIFGGGAVACAFAIATHGAEPDAPAQKDGDSSSETKLEEIVVTSQKREENLQSVPVSVQVVTGQTLAQHNFNALNQLSETLPAVHVSTGDGSNALFIRGIGSGENASFDQSVSIFSDDIYHGRSRMSMATFLDLNRVEILKGPQSTYFGNNAIAGALNIVTQKPGTSFDASGRLLYGQFGTYAAEAAVGGPITDIFGARLALTRNGDNRGWMDNVSTGQRVPTINNEGGRLTLALHPNQSLDATLKVEGSKNLTAGSAQDTPYQYTNCPPPAPIKPGFGGLGGCANALSLGLPIGLDNSQTSGLPNQGGSLSTFEDVLTIHLHQWGQAFTSVSGFYNYHFGQDHDLTNLPLSVLTKDDITGAVDESYHQFSQELRIASPSDSRLQYQAGLYFQDDRLKDFGSVNLFPFNFLTMFSPYLPLAPSADFVQEERVYSAFASVTWKAADRLRFNAGLRTSSVEKKQTGGDGWGYGAQLYGGHTLLPPALWPVIAGIFGGTPQSCCSPQAANSQAPLSRTDRALMPSVGTQYDLAPTAMAYATYTRGFKAGGYNGTALPALNHGDVAFGPEHVDAFELGLKSKWLHDTLRVNVAAFHSDYRDLQVAAQVYVPLTNGYQPFIRNAARSVAQGVELETEWLATSNFRLTANVTYLDAHYVSYPNASHTVLQNYCATGGSNGGAGTAPCAALFPGGVLPYQDLSGRPTDNAPTWSGNLSASYGISIGDYRVTTQVNPFFTTGYFLAGDQGETDDPLEHVGGYVRLDGRVTVGSPDGHWLVDLIGQNLTDRIIVTNYQQGIYQASKERPRNISLQVRYQF